MEKRMYRYAGGNVFVTDVVDTMDKLIQYYPTLPQYVWEVERWKSLLPMYAYHEEGQTKVKLDEAKMFGEIMNENSV